jgi:AraC-like DNA-binding protein
LRRHTRDELWWLTSPPVPVGSFGQCAKRLVLCRTLGEALREGLAFQHLLIDDFVARLRLADGQAQLVVLLRQPNNPRLDYAQKAFMLFVFGLVSWLVARRVPLLRVDYSLPPLGSDTSRMYQAPVAYQQPHIGLRFDARWLDLPVVQNQQSLREFLAQAPANLLVRYRDPGTVTERIRRLLRRQLQDQGPSLEAVGQALGLTAATLRRRLREEGRGFQALKDELRRDAAIEYLGQPTLALADIALQLGFSDASTFHRAFKKWTGLAPGEYRLTHLKAGE